MGTRNDRDGGLLRRVLHRLTSSELELDAEEHQELARETGCTPVGDSPDRVPVTLVGMLRTVTIQPQGQAPALQAELWDGTGSVDIVWIGRRRIPGIEPGRSLKVEGRITRREDGRRVIFNPRYELLSAHALRS
ncbi:nucleic acid binding, OB-fold, tRNA/helicase-type [Acidothermus cellulolyticus 11B]|uniref:Nucleic acid binding, OB-fold, tRNA/helicase-type n=1 Tax=Acidothermus cellulolyticus (strain ATCC 43068 / DSM 8971 / 11B) TaxID=351607 RepID=A0LUR2_ACIC1|nr:OB-fold nucleic acid binding domain-containing protein [Acidothermus cellulolyticus]ABK53172.1 nucleic acid binding, OB-fold, tRNA/helicase-type [Acidothermus cellulolyticus 11B]MBX5447381.1 OB-fold nucleic acid binding domain-containing protein [Acidothermus cellulolyticus]